MRRFCAVALGAGAVALAACSPSGPEPEPAEPEAPCPSGQVYDETGDEPVCVPEACGVGPWGNEADADLFVAAGGSGGDGSQERPFGSIQEAADAMGSDGGGVVTIAAGTYVENLALDDAHDGVVLAGRCAELVTIDGSGAEEPGIAVARGSLEVRGVTVTGGRWGIAVMQTGWPVEPVSLVLRSSTLEGNREVGLAVADVGASVEAVGATVRETASNADGNLGWGVVVQEGASLDATDLLLEGNHGTGLFASSPGTTVALTSAVVRDTQTQTDGTFGRGVEINNGASLDATDLLLEGNHELGLYASNPGTAVALSGVVVRDTQTEGDGTGGRGVVVQDGAWLDATDLLLEDNHEIGLRAEDPGTTVILSGVAVRDTQTRADGNHGRGVEAIDGASLHATDLLLEGNHDLGLLAASPGTTVVLTSAVIRDTLPQADGTSGRGVEVNDGASLDATDLLLQGNHDIGLSAAHLGTTLVLTDAVVRDTQPRTDGTAGWGGNIQEGASLDATDLLFEGNHQVGLRAANPGTTVVLSGAVVRDTQLQSDGTGGWGVGVSDGASLDATDLLLEGNREYGLFATHPGTIVTLMDTVVRDTRPGFGVGGGPGLVIQVQAHIDAVRLAVLRSTGPGAYLVDGSLQCRDCTFEDNGFGGLVVVDDSRVNLSGGSILSSRPTPVAGGGGVGLLTWNFIDLAPTVHLDGVTLSDHPGPALYFRGPGTYEVRDCVFEDSASATGVFDVPGAIIAVQGVGAWDPTAWPLEPSGLLLADNTFSSLPTNAVLLDGSAATLDSNLFEDISGSDLYTQRCDAAPDAVQLLGPPPSTNDCAGPTLLLAPLLQWSPVIWETEAIE